jgi:hypothetical protein
MKIIDKFTKSEEKKQRRRRKLFTFSNPHTRHHLLSSKITKLLHRGNLSSNWSAKQNRAASYLPLPLNKTHQTNSYLESTMMK